MGMACGARYPTEEPQLSLADQIARDRKRIKALETAVRNVESAYQAVRPDFPAVVCDASKHCLTCNRRIAFAEAHAALRAALEAK